MTIGDQVELLPEAIVYFRANAVEASDRPYSITGIYDHWCSEENMASDPTGHPLYHVEDQGTGRKAYTADKQDGSAFGWFLYEDQFTGLPILSVQPRRIN